MSEYCGFLFDSGQEGSPSGLHTFLGEARVKEFSLLPGFPPGLQESLETAQVDQDASGPFPVLKVRDGGGGRPNFSENLRENRPNSGRSSAFSWAPRPKLPGGVSG